MSLFLNLLLGHMIGDFALQPGWLVVAKRKTVRGLLLHVGLIAAATAAVLGSSLREYWHVVLATAVLHIVVERLTISARFHTSSRGLFVFILDQALHMLSLSLLASLALGGADVRVPTFGTELTEPGLAAIAGLVTVVFLGAILAFETANVVIPAEGGNAAILGFDWNRVGGMVERGSALALALAVSPALGMLPFMPRIVYSFTLPQNARARLVLEATSGLALCALTYALVAAVAIIST